MSSSPRLAVIGAGLTGCMAAIRLAELGSHIDLFERRPDLRIDDVDAGRSINLAISTRGLDALERVGLADRILADAIDMRGRMMHATSGALTFQPYGTKSEHVLRSVSRDALNIALLDRVDSIPDIASHFETRVTAIDLAGPSFEANGPSHTGDTLHWDTLIGADGAFSAVRERLRRSGRFDYEQSFLEHGYKELTIPAGPDGLWQIEPHALHIWPRGGHMMIALPNPDRTFTCTLFWPYAGPDGFDRVHTAADVTKVFERQFPDALALMPDLGAEYEQNPVSTLVTVRCQPWFLAGRAILLGDSCHTVVPFYGQGANAALEDVTLLSEALERHGNDREVAFRSFFEDRKPDADALADLALENFIEIRDRVASRWFLLNKKLRGWLHRLLPGLFVPLYTMITFSRTPYTVAVERSRRQDKALRAIAIAGALLLIAASVVIITRAL